jgi:5-methylcytosine-specific restriction protein A
MGKLKNLKPVLGTLAPRLGAAPGDVKAQDRQRYDRNPLRALYGTRRWADLKLFVFVRDGYVCQRTGVLCIGKHPDDNSPVANHKIPHRGNLALFWDPDNVETVTKAVHDSIIQAEEQAVPTGFWD